MSGRLREADLDARSGLIGRLQVLDSRILAIETEITALNGQLASAPAMSRIGAAEIAESNEPNPGQIAQSVAQDLIPFIAILSVFVFAPIARFIDSPGVDSIIALRWAQIPVWIATFWLTNLWMRGAGLERVARWAAMAFALCSSLLMIAAVEYRVEAMLCMFFMAALVLVQRDRSFLAAAIFGA